METQQKDLSYFRLRLQELLNTSFLDMTKNFLSSAPRGLPMPTTVRSSLETLVGNVVTILILCLLLQHLISRE